MAYFTPVDTRLKYPRARVMPKFYDLSIYLYLFTEF